MSMLSIRPSWLNDFQDTLSDHWLKQWSQPPMRQSVHFDIKETQEGFLFVADVPGFDANQLSISFENHVLSIRGERDLQNEHHEKEYLLKERTQSSFSRQFQLPDYTGEEIQASCKKGILEILVPKAKQKTQKINIKVEE